MFAPVLTTSPPPPLLNPAVDGNALALTAKRHAESPSPAKFWNLQSLLVPVTESRSFLIHAPNENDELKGADVAAGKRFVVKSSLAPSSPGKRMIPEAMPAPP